MLTELDEYFLRECIELSARSVVEPGLTPFAAIVVLDGKEIGRGMSSVIRLHDATAHAEVLAIRAAGLTLQNHLLEGATLYCNGEPCPMCLLACYWAKISRVACAATVADSSEAGFEDRELYAELARPAKARTLRVEYANDDLRAAASRIIHEWQRKWH